MTMFSGLFKKHTALDKAFAEIEENMTAMVELDSPPPLDLFDDIEPLPPHATDDVIDTDSQAEHTRMTAYAQSRLSALHAFEEVHQAARHDLERLVEGLGRVAAAHHSAQSFLGTVHNSIHRANELELSNVALLSENRRLATAAERVKRLSSQLETLTEGYKRREAKLVDEAEALRSAIGVLQLELGDARSTIATVEGERAELHNEVASKSSALDRIMRESELLRERQINLSMDIETLQRRYTDLERKHDELTAVHAAEHSMIAELRGKVSEKEKEISRLQKSFDVSQTRLTEAEHTVRALEAEAERRDHHHLAVTQKLQGDVEALRTRIEVAGRTQQNADNEIAALRQTVADLATEKKIADEKIANLKADLAAERKPAPPRRDPARVDANGELSLTQALLRDSEALRRERAAIEHLAIHERAQALAVRTAGGGSHGQATARYTPGLVTHAAE